MSRYENNHCRPTLKSLEDRQLLSIGTPTLSRSGVLSMTGNGADDNVRIIRRDERIVVQHLSSASPREWSVAARRVHSIVLSGNACHDTFVNTTSRPVGFDDCQIPANCSWQRR